MARSSPRRSPCSPPRSVGTPSGSWRPRWSRGAHRWRPPGARCRRRAGPPPAMWRNRRESMVGTIERSGIGGRDPHVWSEKARCCLKTSGNSGCIFGKRMWWTKKQLAKKLRLIHKEWDSRTLGKVWSWPYIWWSKENTVSSRHMPRPRRPQISALWRTKLGLGLVQKSGNSVTRAQCHTNPSLWPDFCILLVGNIHLNTWSWLYDTIWISQYPKRWSEIPLALQFCPQL